MIFGEPLHVLEEALGRYRSSGPAAGSAERLMCQPAQLEVEVPVLEIRCEESGALPRVGEIDGADA